MIISPIRVARTVSRSLLAAGAALALVALPGCATNLGTGDTVVAELHTSFPTTVGKLVDAHMDTRHRLRVYLQICEDAGPDDGPVCSDDGLRVLALVEARKKRVLERLAHRHLVNGAERPVYVYGPMCEGFEEMILVPRCQHAVAIGVWDPYLRDYVVYSTQHGNGSFVESEGFETFLDLTGRAAGLARKAVR